MKKLSALFLLAGIFLSGCRKNEFNSTTSTTVFTAISSDDALSKDVSLVILPRSDDYPSIPQDPNNPLTAEKVELGKLLFHETRLGVTSRRPEGLHTYSCATCHHAEAGFQSGLYQALAEGGTGFGIIGELRIPSSIYLTSQVDAPSIHTPTALNIAYQDVMTWSGSMGSGSVNTGTESVWKVTNGTDLNFLGFKGAETITMAAIKNHKLTPDTVWLASVPEYKNLFDVAFPAVPENKRISNRNVALAIAAYQRTLIPNQAPFQRWLQGDKRAMTADQHAGMNLFFGKAKCAKCHTGPALNSMQFFALGFGDMQQGVHGAINIPANNDNNKGRSAFTGRAADMFKFKVPQLYNLKDVNFFGHGSSFNSVEEVISYKNAAVSQNSNVPASQLAKQFVPLNLTTDEINKLTIFVRDALYDPNLVRYEPVSVPSGNCVPNNDQQSRIDRGCQ